MLIVSLMIRHHMTWVSSTVVGPWFRTYSFQFLPPLSKLQRQLRSVFAPFAQSFINRGVPFATCEPKAPAALIVPRQLRRALLTGDVPFATCEPKAPVALIFSRHLRRVLFTGASPSPLASLKRQLRLFFAPLAQSFINRGRTLRHLRT